MNQIESNPILQYFPKTAEIKEPRQMQIEALDKFWKIFGLGTRYKIIAPVGAGKSAIAMAVARRVIALNCEEEQEQNKLSVLITSPLNQLVDQYSDSFSELGLTTLKGRKHYLCMAGRKDASQGYCRVDECSKGLSERLCSNREECKGCRCLNCVYPRIFRAFQNSELGNTNFTMFLLGITNNPYLIVIDESDMSEEFIRMHYSVTVPRSFNSDFNVAIEQLKEYEIELKEQLEYYKNQKNTINTTEQIRDIEKLIGTIDYLIDDYNTYHELWCVTQFKNAKGEPRTRFEPIRTERFIEPLLKNKLVIEMSATLPRHEDDLVVEVDSPFLPEVRPWEFVPIGRMSRKYRDRNYPKLALWLSQLSGKTIVHCHSYAFASELGKHLRNLKVYPLLQVDANYKSIFDTETVSRYDAVRGFKAAEDPDKILLSVNLARGVNFEEQEIVNNIIAVIPFPNPAEPLTKAKNELLGRLWQDEKIATTIMQSYGRIHRDEKIGSVRGKSQVKTTYVTDSNFNNSATGFWFDNHKELFHKWFLEAEVTT